MRMHLAWLLISLTAPVACSSGMFSGQTAKQSDTPSSVATGESAAATKGADGQLGQDSSLPSKVVVDALKDKCAQAAASLSTSTQTLNYPGRETCSFGTAPNLERKDKFIQAAEVSPQTLNLPDGEICGISLISPAEARLHYDDFLILAVDSRAIFISNSGITKYLKQEQGIYTWDFNKVLGQKIENFEADAYCLGRGQDCILPGHDKEGAVSLKLNPEQFAPIAASLNGKKSVAMDLTATGDNDDTDCGHTALNLSIQIQYIPR